jgi:hypothetical protein
MIKTDLEDYCLPGYYAVWSVEGQPTICLPSSFTMLSFAGYCSTLNTEAVSFFETSIDLKLVVCILLRVLGQVEGFRLTQWFEYFI